MTAIPTLTTCRLSLRPMRPNDFPAYAALMAGPRAVYMGGPYDTMAAWGPPLGSCMTARCLAPPTGPAAEAATFPPPASRCWKPKAPAPARATRGRPAALAAALFRAARCPDGRPFRKPRRHRVGGVRLLHRLLDAVWPRPLDHRTAAARLRPSASSTSPSNGTMSNRSSAGTFARARGQRLMPPRPPAPRATGASRSCRPSSATCTPTTSLEPGRRAPWRHPRPDAEAALATPRRGTDPCLAPHRTGGGRGMTRHHPPLPGRGALCRHPGLRDRALRDARLPARGPRPFTAFYGTERSRFVTGPLTPELAARALMTYAGHWHVRGYGRWMVEDRAYGRDARQCGPVVSRRLARTGNRLDAFRGRRGPRRGP
jgi:hypothetical protein